MRVSAQVNDLCNPVGAYDNRDSTDTHLRVYQTNDAKLVAKLNWRVLRAIKRLPPNSSHGSFTTHGSSPKTSPDGFACRSWQIRFPDVAKYA